MKPSTLGLFLLVACAPTDRAPLPAASAPTANPTAQALVPAASPVPDEPVEARWEKQLADALPWLRARAKTLLDVCSVVEVPAESPDETPSLACLVNSLGAPRSTHEFRRATSTDDYYEDARTEVIGSFVEPDADERLLVLYGGTSGANGGRSGFLFRRRGHEWPLVRTFEDFPATSCAAIPRPQRTSLLLCGFDNHWQGATNVWASLFDAASPLSSEDGADGPTNEHGFLRPLQNVLTMDEARAHAVHGCPSGMQSLALLPEAPIHVTTTPTGARLLVDVYTTTRAAARARMCQEDAPEKPPWRMHHLIYSLALRGERLVAAQAPERRRQDAELRQLAIVPPP